jgi:epsilon-lactone hydrolase
METSNDRPVLHVPARDIPVPSHLSPQAQKMLAKGRPTGGAAYPPPGDIPAWRAYVAALEKVVVSMVKAQASQPAADTSEINVDGLRIFVSKPHKPATDDQAVYLDIHGGALISGSGESCRIWGAGLAAMLGARVWSVDYRMPPDHPYPAPLDDCVAAYRALLRKHPPTKIIVGGGSAGGNLAAALILRARDEGLPLPAGAVLRTPEVDLTESGDSFRTNMGVDTIATTSLMPANLLYAGGHILSHPYLSPLFGDFSKGFPPTLLSAGTRDLFLSNAVRLHRALRAVGVRAELHLFEGAPHAGFRASEETIAAPEDEDLDREVRRFAHELWGART